MRKLFYVVIIISIFACKKETEDKEEVKPQARAITPTETAMLGKWYWKKEGYDGSGSLDSISKAGKFLLLGNIVVAKHGEAKQRYQKFIGDSTGSSESEWYLDESSTPNKKFFGLNPNIVSNAQLANDLYGAYIDSIGSSILILRTVSPNQNGYVYFYK